MSHPLSNCTIRTILCATDFSAASEEALRVACRLAAGHAAKLIVVHIASAAVPGLRVTESLVLHDDYLGAIEAQLLALQGRAPQVRMQFRIEEGYPSIQIVKLAREIGADVVVIGSSATDASPRLRSTAQEVLAFAPCEVLKVTAKRIEHSQDPHPEEAGHERAINQHQQHGIS